MRGRRQGLVGGWQRGGPGGARPGRFAVAGGYLVLASSFGSVNTISAPPRLV